MKTAPATPLARLINRHRDTLNARKTVKNPFARIKAPDGDYYAQIKRVGFYEQKDKDNPNGEKITVFSIQAIIVSNINGETDTTYVGEQPRMEQRFKETEKSTIEDITDRMYGDLQQLDVDTSLIIFDESERETEEQYTLELVCAWTQFKSEYVQVNISTSSQGYKNANLRGIVDYQQVVDATGLTDLPYPRTDEEFSAWWEGGGQPEEIVPEEDEQEYEEGAEPGEEGAEALAEDGEQYEELVEEVVEAPPARRPAAKKAAPAPASRPAPAPAKKGPPPRQAAAAPAPAKKAVAAKKAPPPAAGRPGARPAPAPAAAPRRGLPPRR